MNSGNFNSVCETINDCKQPLVCINGKCANVQKVGLVKNSTCFNILHVFNLKNEDDTRTYNEHYDIDEPEPEPEPAPKVKLDEIGMASPNFVDFQAQR